MRRIGNLPNESQANRFCDYLQTQSIDAKASSSDESAPPSSTPHDIWIRSEQDVPRAKELIAEFQSDPASGQYDVSAEAERQRRKRSAEIAEKIASQKKAQMQLRRGTKGNLGGQNLGGLAGDQSPASIPITIAIVVLATLIGFVTEFAGVDGAVSPVGRGGPTIQQTLYNALSCVDYPLFVATEGDGLASLKQGEVWRLFTPILLHGSIFHLVFNMFNLYVLGGVVERIHGSLFYLMLILICGGIATLSQIVLADLIGGPFGGARAIGASGALFGVFGFVWIRPKVDRSYPVEIPSFNIKFMLGFLVLCFTPLLPNIANGAHMGGLVAGMIVAGIMPAKT